MLSDTATYTKLPSDPTSVYKNTIVGALSSVKDYAPPSVYWRIYPNTTQPPPIFW